jgi:hypothetical protein
VYRTGVSISVFPWHTNSKGKVIDLEGHDLVVVEVGHSDTDDTTCLHVPSIGLVVAGDVAYNDVHLYLAESNAHTRREWIAALDTIEALHPQAVQAGPMLLLATRASAGGALHSPGRDTSADHLPGQVVEALLVALRTHLQEREKT